MRHRPLRFAVCGLSDESGKGSAWSSNRIFSYHSLAQCAVEQPKRHTEIWAIPSGCEEEGCYGMINFLTAFGDQLEFDYFINP